jgi:hypothetical protein
MLIVIFILCNKLIFIYLTKTICNNIILSSYICTDLFFRYVNHERQFYSYICVC